LQLSKEVERVEKILKLTKKAVYSAYYYSRMILLKLGVFEKNLSFFWELSSFTENLTKQEEAEDDEGTYNVCVWERKN
jgi:hypothetical protein